MNTTHPAIYARVSSEQQATTHTIASQVAALQERVATDGLALSEMMQFLDEGYSGGTLVRPALERLRDLVAAGAVDRLYVHSPDRLARKYAYQALLVEEFQRMGVEGRVPAGCGYCFGPSPNPSERGQSVGDQHSKPVFKTPSMSLDLHLSTISPSTTRS